MSNATNLAQEVVALRLAVQILARANPPSPDLVGLLPVLVAAEIPSGLPSDQHEAFRKSVLETARSLLG